MVQLILMRHGNTFEAGQTPLQVGLKTDLPLTAYGLLQAQAMAEHLAAKGIVPQAIYAGRLKRQIESARVIAQFFGLPLQEAPSLNEIDYGLWEGLSSEEIQKQWPKEYGEWTLESKWQSHIFQGSYEGHLTSLMHWLKSLAKQPGTILAVTSNGLLRFLRNEKVHTGHFCEFQVDGEAIHISKWNQKPGAFP